MDDLRYYNSETKFLVYAYDVFGNYFNSQDSLNSFYNRIDTIELKNKFLKISGMYKFLVVDGQYVNKTNLNQVYIDYLDHTNKFIAIFAMIEDLYSEVNYKEFYGWLSKKSKNIYPIENAQMLQCLHDDYLTVHGSTLKVVKFFESLSHEIKRLFLNKFKMEKDGEVNDEEVTDEEMADEEFFVSTVKSFNQIRNNYVHKAILPAQFSKGNVIHSIGNKMFLNNLSFDDINKIFENGFLVYFHFNDYEI